MELAHTRRHLLMDPRPRNNPHHLAASDLRTVWFPVYTLEPWHVDFVDEAVDVVNVNYACDLVGLSIMTCYAPQAMRSRRNLGSEARRWC